MERPRSRGIRSSSIDILCESKVNVIVSMRVQYRGSKVCIARGGHQYVHCTDTRNRDQNLIGPILGP